MGFHQIKTHAGRVISHIHLVRETLPPLSITRTQQWPPDKEHWRQKHFPRRPGKRHYLQGAAGRPNLAQRTKSRAPPGIPGSISHLAGQLLWGETKTGRWLQSNGSKESTGRAPRAGRPAPPTPTDRVHPSGSRAGRREGEPVRETKRAARRGGSGPAKTSGGDDRHRAAILSGHIPSPAVNISGHGRHRRPRRTPGRPLIFKWRPPAGPRAAGAAGR